MAKLPLEGIRILDAGDVWAGPYSCTLLGDLGAEVIKIETIQRFGVRGQLNPPPTRPEGTPPALWGYPDGVPAPDGTYPWNRHAIFTQINRNKWAGTLNIRDPRGLDLFKQLVAKCDVVVENYAAGVFEKLGLGYEELKKVKPDVILMSMPLFGCEGPYSHYRGMGSTADPISGHATLRGYMGEDSSGLQNTVHSDAVAAPTAAFAALTAINYRNRTGKGQFIDFGQVESYMAHLGDIYMDYSMNGRIQGTRENRHSAYAQGSYQTAGDDRWVTISIRDDHEWQRFCQVLGSPEWTRDVRFSTALRRWKNHDDLDAHIQDWTLQHDRDEIVHKLQDAGVPVGPVYDQRDVYEDEHLRERGFFERVTQQAAGTHRYPGMNWKFSKSPLGIRIPANCLGEHNGYVLKDLLGLSEPEVRELEEQQVVGTVYLPGSDQ